MVSENGEQSNQIRGLVDYKAQRDRGDYVADQIPQGGHNKIYNGNDEEANHGYEVRYWINDVSHQKRRVGPQTFVLRHTNHRVLALHVIFQALQFPACLSSLF